MPEKFEPKFSEAEIAKKQEEAQEMDKKAKEMVEKGEAKTPQEAIEKIEAKELEKSPEEILKEALPLAWEEALKFAQEKGFATSPEIKKRIDLAKKYNLEVEHFFYDPEKLERKIPTQEQIEKTAKELEYVREFAEEFSKQSRRPVFCIFNARNGTIYSYGMDTMNAQLNFQYKALAKQQTKTIHEIREEFAHDLKNNQWWKENKRTALMETTNEWIKDKTIKHFIGKIRGIKIRSGGTQEVIHEIGEFDIIYLSEISKKDCNFMVIDATGWYPSENDYDTEGRTYPAAFRGWELYSDLKGIEKVQLSNQYNPERSTDFKEQQQRWKTDNISELVRDDFNTRTIRNGKKFVQKLKTEKNFCILLNAFSPSFKERDPWFDNFPQALGRVGKRFAHGGLTEEVVYPTERIVQSAQRVEYLSEKVKNALRYYQRDEEGRNWFERNFEGGMLGRKNAPQKGSQEYLEKFRKWVPYETDEKGEARLDDRGYPISRKEAPMTVAAEDELARLEAAMEELGQE